GVAEQYGVPIYGLAGTAHESAAAKRGVEFIAELYVDLDYHPDGTLRIERAPRPRGLDSVRARVARMLSDGVLDTVDGSLIPVAVQPVCVHSDLPNAAEVAALVRDLLDGS